MLSMDSNRRTRGCTNPNRTRMRIGVLWGALVFAFALPALSEDGPTFADLGRCELERGGVIEDCRVGYRTVGELNADRSNAILFPTWFSGSSADLAAMVGPNFLDPERYFVIVVDALGNGVSSSPSNSETQSGDGFPEITIGDMVESQHRLITEVLGLDRLHAVVGISMGGMQTFEWAVRYPGFMRRVVPITGSPRLAAYDIALWHAYRQLLDLAEECECDEAGKAMQGLVLLVGRTPEYHARESDRSEVLATIDDAATQRAMEKGRSDDLGSQALAMMTHDVSRSYGDDIDRAAAVVQADMLVVVGVDDHIVTPGPALSFAESIGGKRLVLQGDCGHGAPTCSAAEMNQAIALSLNGDVPTASTN